MEGWKWEEWVPHLEELRVRLIRALVLYTLAVVVAWFFHERIIDFISSPVGRLYIFNVQDAFVVRLKTSLLSALLVAFPYFLWEVWGFVSPALYPHEKKALLLVLLSALILFYSGAALSLFVVMPRAIGFLLAFAEGFTPVISANEYLNFVFWSVVIFGVVFELPVAVGILSRMGVISADLLASRRREMIVAIFILTAVISPTVDVFSLLLMAVPLVLLYEVSIWVAKVVGKRSAV